MIPNVEHEAKMAAIEIKLKEVIDAIALVRRRAEEDYELTFGGGNFSHYAYTTSVEKGGWSIVDLADEVRKLV